MWNRLVCFRRGLTRAAFLMLLLTPVHVFAAEARTLMGTASWYGTTAHGKMTASGRIFSRMHFTAAHKTLPFGMVLRVYNLHNAYHVLVAITDRGPFAGERQLDVSYRAARVLNFVRRGITTVWAEVVSDSKGVPLDADSAYYLQFGVRPDEPSAFELLRDVRFRLKLAAAVFRVPDEPVSPYHICAGPWRTFKEAEEVLEDVPLYYDGAQIILGPASGNELPRHAAPEAIRALQNPLDSHKKRRSAHRVQRK